MKEYNGLEIPVGVSLTHDKGKAVVFAYVGGKGRLGMRAKRFNPRVCGGMERALKQAIRWRKQALREHTAAVAALDEPAPSKPAVAAVAQSRKVAAVKKVIAVKKVTAPPTRKVAAVRKPVAAPPRSKVTPARKSVAAPPRKVTTTRKPVAAPLRSKMTAVRKPVAAPAPARRKPAVTRRAR